MDYIKAYPMPEQPEGESLRAKLEVALGYPVTTPFEPSPVRVLAEDGELVVHLEADEEPAAATWKKIDAIFGAHVKDPGIVALGPEDFTTVGGLGEGPSKLNPPHDHP